MLIRLRIADISIDAQVAHKMMQSIAADYEEPASTGGVLSQPDMQVNITQDDIDAERKAEHAMRAGASVDADDAGAANASSTFSASDMFSGPTDAGQSETIYSDGYLETLVVLRKIAEAAPDFDAFLMHGATISYRGRAYAFLAHSGTGKSTHIQLWRDALGDQVTVINGDKPLVRRRGCVNGCNGHDGGNGHDGAFVAYGTPYNGKERWGSNTSAPLAGVCLLERGTVDSLERLDHTADGKFIVEKLIQQVYVPRDPRRAAKLLGLLDELVRTVPLWRLRCTPTPAAFDAAFPMTYVDED